MDLVKKMSTSNAHLEQRRVSLKFTMELFQTLTVEIISIIVVDVKHSTRICKTIAFVLTKQHKVIYGFAQLHHIRAKLLDRKCREVV